MHQCKNPSFSIMLYLEIILMDPFHRLPLFFYFSPVFNSSSEHPALQRFLLTSRVTPTQNENFVIIHLPPCRSKPVKALFVFGTQFKIFWMRIGRLVIVLLTAQTINTVNAQKSMKDFIKIVHLLSVFQP